MSTADETHARMQAARRALYVRVQSAVVDWHSLRQFAASRIEQHKNELANADANAAAEVAKLQGAISENRYLLNLEEKIREYLSSNPARPEQGMAETETISSK